MKIANGLKVSAEIILGVSIVTMTILAFKMMGRGEQTGIQLLLSAVMFLLFMWLGWIQPKATGIGLIFLGLLVIIFFGNYADDPSAWKLMGSPFLIAGSLFLGADWKLRHP